MPYRLSNVIAVFSLVIASGCESAINRSDAPSLAMCDAERVNQPYQKMMRGFQNRSISEVISAYHNDPILGPVTSPTFRSAGDMIAAFGYVETENGDALDIKFKIVHREHRGDRAVDVGYYFIDGWPLEYAYGRFTTLISCHQSGDWRFDADMSAPATQADWEAAPCISSGICAADGI